MIKRCNHRIQHENGRVEDFKSINLAKKESRVLQTKGLGMGQVTVVEKLHEQTTSS